jgi:predicted membrane channel-forming protein YqfA (hemolysin III family)
MDNITQVSKVSMGVKTLLSATFIVPVVYIVLLLISFDTFSKYLVYIYLLTILLGLATSAKIIIDKSESQEHNRVLDKLYSTTIIVLVVATFLLFFMILVSGVKGIS